MSTKDVLGALTALEPTTAEARLRALMPTIERKLAEGVQLAAIHAALKANGIEVAFPTLKTYLYRYRKKHPRGRTDVTTAASKQTGSYETEAASYETHLVSNDTANNQPDGPASMQELDQLMKPDPQQQAEELARYERLGRQSRRTIK